MSDIDILTQIERALVSDSQTQRDLAMDGAHVEIQRLRKENAILDKELVRHIRHASELISQVERQRKVLDQAELVLDQAKDCINAETPEDITFGEAEDDTISKIRDAMRDIAAVTSEQST